MADKTPLKYEDAQHKPFEPGDTIPDSFFDLRGLIHAGEGFTVTEDGQGRVTITNTCCPPPDSDHIIAEVNAPGSIEEGEQVCWTIVLDGPVEGSDLTLQGVLSGDEQDTHNYPAPSVTIPAGSSTGQMCVQTTDDTTVEPDRELCLAVADNPRIVSAPAPRCVTVQDNDCDPNWQDTGALRCTGTNVEAFQEDGCGDSRWNDTGTPVAWTNDGAAVCVDDVLIQPQVNQCGDTRDFDTGEACGCVPNWQNTGQTRCTGTNVENFQEDGCGNSRWNDSGTAVAWTNDGAAECVDGTLRQPQVNQCGDTRVQDTGTPCGIEEPAFGAFTPNHGCCAIATGLAQVLLTFRPDGSGQTEFSCWGGGTPSWLPGGNGADWEIMLENLGIAPNAPGTQQANVWVPITSTRFWGWDYNDTAPPHGGIMRYRLKARNVNDPSTEYESGLGQLEVRSGQECL